MAILALLPEAEREEVIRFNVPRVRKFGVFDEVYLRTEIDRDARAVAALSVGTISSRLSADRLPTVVDLLKREAAVIGARQSVRCDPAAASAKPGAARCAGRRVTPAARRRIRWGRRVAR